MSQESFKTVQIVSVFETIFKLNMNTSGHCQQTIMAIHETQSTEDYIIVDSSKLSNLWFIEIQ